MFPLCRAVEGAQRPPRQASCTNGLLDRGGHQGTRLGTAVHICLAVEIEEIIGEV